MQKKIILTNIKYQQQYTHYKYFIRFIKLNSMPDENSLAYEHLQGLFADKATLLAKAYKESGLPARCFIHNTRIDNVPNIMNEGLSPGKFTKNIGFMVYDFTDINTIIQGLARATWVFLGENEQRDFIGNVTLDDIVAMIVSENNLDTEATTHTRENKASIERDLRRLGSCFYDIAWRSNIRTEIAIDLSIRDIDKLKDNAFNFALRHIPEGIKNRRDFVNRLQQISVMSIWLDRLIEGFKKYNF